MNIYKNYIEKNDVALINKTFLSNTFPWYFESKQVETGKKDTLFFSHCFVDKGNINSHAMFLIEPILKKLNIKNLLNVRANLCPKGPFYCSWHVDRFTENLSHKTAIFYVNTNNGATEFKNKKVKCEKNKIVIFDAKQKHKALGQTDKNVRMVINFNYESK
jgi:hypothetical protein